MQYLPSLGVSLKLHHPNILALPHRKSILPAATLALLFLSAAFASAQAGESVVPLADHTPPQILNGIATRIGHYDSAQKLRLTLSIQPPHMAEEEEFLRELTDRTSPNFHRFLTPEEWNARFGPSAKDEQAVVDWAVSQGFTVTHRFNHRLLVDVEAPVSAIEKAFGVTIDQYRYKDEVDFSNDRDPVIPAHLQGIVFNIQGLNNIQRDHGSRPGPQAKGADYAEGPAYAEGAHIQADAKAPRPQPAATPNDTSNSTLFTNGAANPTEIYSSEVYNYNGLQNLGHCCNPQNDSGGTPIVSNIAIAAFGNFISSDLTGFQTTYPYLAVNVTPENVDGSINCANDPGACPSGETTQDVEWTVATANSFGAASNTSHIYVYIGVNESNSTFTDIYGQMLSDNYARVFTTSWSCTEVYGCSTSTMDSRHNIFNSMVGQGWTLIAASGDRGSADDCNFNSPAHETVAYPGSDYDVLAAGGTQLTVNSDGTWNDEYGWQGGTFSGACSDNDGGSGGGVSSYYAKPGYQVYSTWSEATMRQTPDISLNALGIGQSLYIDGALTCCANGTSIVAPELAGFFAQENAYLGYIGNICGSGASACAPIGQPMQYFYPAAYYGSGYIAHFPFYDMTGNYCNDNDVTIADSLGYYCTGAGWDNVTGWGSANMLQLAWAINSHLIPATGTHPTVTWTGPNTGKWYNSDQKTSWTVTDPEPSGSTPSSGIAGFTQGWDSISPDSYSQPHGGSGDSFWTGPESANLNTGCLSFSGTDGCAGGVSQGCHTAHVRGWNNQGWTTGDQTYGSVCYDTTAPTVSDSLSGTQPTGDGWYVNSVKVTLSAIDPGATANPQTGSGIKTTYYAIDTAACSSTSLTACAIYSAPFAFSTAGSHSVSYFTEDKAGNFSSKASVQLNVDASTPSTTAHLNPSSPQHNGWYNAPVSVTFTAMDTKGPGVSSTYWADNNPSCASQASALSHCSTYGGGSFQIANNGANTLTYFSEDLSNRIESSLKVSILIDDIPPATAALLQGHGMAGTYYGPVTVILHAKDNASGVAATYFSLGGGLGRALYTHPITVSAGGSVTIHFYSVDMAGNTESAQTVTFTDFPAEILTGSPTSSAQ